LSAAVVDLPNAKEIAEKTISFEGMTGRITFQESNFWKVDLGSGYDSQGFALVIELKGD